MCPLCNEGNPMPKYSKDAIYKQNLTIIDSYRVELRGIELAINTNSSKLDYSKAVALIAKHEK